MLRLFHWIGLLLAGRLRFRRREADPTLPAPSATPLPAAADPTAAAAAPAAVASALKRFVEVEPSSKDADASRTFEDTPRIRADAARLRLALADLHERSGNRDRMFELLDSLVEAGHAGHDNLLAAHYAWFADDYDRAPRYLQPVLDAYHELESRDETLLFLHGLPPVIDTVCFAAALHVLRRDLPAARELVAREQQRRCDAPELFRVLLFIDCIERRDFGPLLTDRDAAVAPGQLQVLRAQTMSDRRAAADVIDRVCRQQQPAWLNDVLLLAQCQLAARHGDAAEEETLRREFLFRRPLLLEPGRAFLFNLLEYQETLKPAARHARQS